MTDSLPTTPLASMADALDRLTTLRTALIAYPAARLIALQALLPPHLFTAVMALEDQHAEGLKDLEYEIACLEARISVVVLEHGVTATSPTLQAVWMPGRVTWKTRDLDQYAILHPEVREYRKQGDPYVVIRATNGPRPERS